MVLRHHNDAELRAQACEWLVALKDPDIDPESPYAELKDRWSAFSAWFTQSPAHLQAFTNAVRASQLLSSIDPDHLIDVEDLLRAPQNNVVFLDPSDSRTHTLIRAMSPSGASPSRSKDNCDSVMENGRPTPYRRRVVRWVSVTSVAVFVAVLALFVYQRPQASTLYFSSGIGERLFVPLEDGSGLQLNTRSRVSVQFTGNSREVQLLEGEVLFDVRHDPARTFRVIANGVIVKDVGTQFSVYRHGSEVSVSVVDGRVEISAKPSYYMLDANTAAQTTGAGATSLRLPAMLSAGKRADISVRDTVVKAQVSVLSEHDLTRELAWKEGWVSFQGETLATAIEQLNRYNRRQFRISDPVVASWRLGGTFKTTDPDGFAITLSRTFDVRIRPSKDRPDIIEIERASRLRNRSAISE